MKLAILFLLCLPLPAVCQNDTSETVLEFDLRFYDQRPCSDCAQNGFAADTMPKTISPNHFVKENPIVMDSIPQGFFDMVIHRKEDEPLLP